MKAGFLHKCGICFTGTLILFLMQIGGVHASHIVGGDLQYRCLGNNQFEISLTLRRDCINGNPNAQFDNPAHVGIFNSAGVLMTQLAINGVLQMRLRNNDTLNEIITKDCGITGGNVCVHTTTYIEVVTLPIIPGGYILAYQRCCRNFTINNIIDPATSGATYTLEIKEEAMRLCNKSPRLGAYPPIYICGGTAIDFDLHAQDEEGDSVVYKLCTPYLGASQAMPLPTTPSNPPYALVQFSNPYSLTNMIGGLPPLEIGQSNGRMTGFAEPVIAQYLIAYCIEEYRNGVLLSVLRRDFQVNVRICSSAPKAEFKTDFTACSLPVEIQCTDQSVDNFSTLRSWRWTLDDGSNVQSSIQKNPKFTVNKEGNVRIKLIIESESGCSDTIQKELNIRLLKPEARFNTEYTACMLPIQLKCNDRSVNPGSNFQSWSWIINDGFNNQTSTLQNPTFNINKEGSLRVILIVANVEGCRDTLIEEIEIKLKKPKADFKSEYLSCKLPTDLRLTDLSTDNFSNIQTWNWNISDGFLNLISNDRNPIFNIQKEGTYRSQLIVESASGCRDTIKREIVIKIDKPEFESQKDTICRFDTLQIKGRFPGNYTYEWNPSTDLSCSNCPNPKAYPKNSTQYILTSKGNQCERYDTINIIVKTCIINPCDIFLLEKCLPNGMIELSVVDAAGKLVDPGIMKHELFWNVMASSTHSQYAIQNQNPIILFNGDDFSLTSKYYSWPPKTPQTYENANICTQRLRKKLDLSCAGPCKDLEFILSSCEDDYDKNRNLQFPKEICESVCSDECNFIVALFEKEGQLVNPSLYEISWSTGGAGAFVHMMQPYYNTLSVKVKKGDCVWRGKYIKSCTQYNKIFIEEELVERNLINANSNSMESLFTHSNAKVYNLSGQEVAANFNQFLNLAHGIYLVSYLKDEETIFFKINR